MAIRAFRISSAISLIESTLPLPAKQAPKERAPVNHIWLYDRSGSMSGLLGQLCEDLIAQIQFLPIGDTLTLGWFSGEGQHRILFKGIRMTNKLDTAIVQLIKDNSSTVGMTCFSESLEELAASLNDLQAFSPYFAFAFFTDGHPVVSNYAQEQAKIFKVLQSIKGKLTSSLFIGYGENYNKELMLQMSETVGGSLLHSRDLSEVKIALTAFTGGASSVPKRNIQTIPGDRLVVFTEHEGTVLTYPTAESTISVDERIGRVYYLVRSIPANLDLGEIPTRVLDLTDLPLMRACYAGALSLVQRALSAEALDLLNWVGDRALLEGVVNAYTNTEYGTIEAQLLAAVSDPAQRFKKGRDTNCVPAEDAFCLLDLLNLLMEDESAVFYPRHPKFEYRRIGKARKTKDGYPHFEASGAGVPFSSLTWSKEKMNLSVFATIQGTVTLLEKNGQTAEKLGLRTPYPTKVFRNYALIKDGKVNLDKLPISCSAEVQYYLQKLDWLKLVERVEEDDPMVIDDAVPTVRRPVLILSLASLPTINRRRAKAARSANLLAHQAIEELRLECIMKVLNQHRREEKEKAKVFQSNIEQYLEANGIKSGAFNPPVMGVIEGDARDYEVVRSFEVKVKGANSLPKVEDVVKKVKEGKATTLVQQFMAQGLELLHASNDFEATWKQYKGELAKLRSTVQESKFALLLSKGWFEEFKSRAESTIVVKEVIHKVAVDTVVTIEISEDRVEID